MHLILHAFIKLTSLQGLYTISPSDKDASTLVDPGTCDVNIKTGQDAKDNCRLAKFCYLSRGIFRLLMAALTYLVKRIL